MTIGINSAIGITSATYQVTVESLSLQGELEVVKEADRKHTMATWQGRFSGCKEQQMELLLKHSTCTGIPFTGTYVVFWL